MQAESTPAPDERIFDKAERAALKERLTAKRDQLNSEIQLIEKDLKSTNSAPPALTQRKRRTQAIESTEA